MTTFDSIIKAARALDLAERIRLARTLLAEASSAEQEDEAAVGQHGLASLTESTCKEDWSEFYPPELGKRKAG